MGDFIPFVKFENYKTTFARERARLLPSFVNKSVYYNGRFIY